MFLMLKKNMLRQQQEILEKHPKLPNKKQKAYTQIAPVHRDGFYTNPGIHPSFTLRPHLTPLHPQPPNVRVFRKKKRRSVPAPLGYFFIVGFKNSVSFYFVKKIRKLPSILYDNCL